MSHTPADTRLFTLFSSSAGNCSCLSGANTTLLIDAGGSCRRILTTLASHDIDASKLDGIVLTHEHSDHISALKVLLRRVHVPVFGTYATINYLADHDLVPPDAQLCPLAGAGMIGDIAFDPFPTQHDAGDTCGYVFQFSDGRRVGFATDLGRFTDEVCDNLSGCSTVVLESNYDYQMLIHSNYPLSLIRRIRGGWGHLSNDDCAAAAVRLARSGMKKLLLAHTSKQNNLEELALRTTLDALHQAGFDERDVLVEVAPKFSPSPMVTL